MTQAHRPILLAAFEDRRQALEAVSDLEQAGFSADDVGFVLRGEDAVEGGMITDATGAKDAKGALAGAAGGSVIGGLLGAGAALLVPGVGPVLAGGILTMTIGGAIAGTAIGGILGALEGLELSEEEARFYEQQFHAGKAIVAVKTSTRARDAMEILRRHGGYGFETRCDEPIRTEGFLSEP